MGFPALHLVPPVMLLAVLANSSIMGVGAFTVSTSLNGMNSEPKFLEAGDASFW
jgi:hypothetical protein